LTPEETDVSQPQRAFIPAAGRDWLLPLYDPLGWLLGAGRLHAELLAQAGLAPGMRVLDVGCGTGSLVVRLCGDHREVDVTALDPDPKALAVARRKADRAGARVRFDQGFGDALPYPDASFDRVFSSMMFHHLERAVKQGMLREVHRVLRPGGSLHLSDFSRSDDGSDGLLARLVHHGGGTLDDNTDARIAAMMGEAGFQDVGRLAVHRTLFGRVAVHRGRRGAR
jgi:ubiquinone/menaquinone biosynthesis C-methylase UbiE